MNSLRVAFFLAVRQIQRSSVWSTALIIVIMTLTFLNLVVVSGILTGLVEGASRQTRVYYSSDLIIKPESGRHYIRGSTEILRTLDIIPDVESYSARYLAPATLEANYGEARKSGQSIDSAGTQLMGIDPEAEDSIASLSQFIVEGDWLSPTDRNQAIIGADLLSKYQRGADALARTVDNVDIGERVRIQVNGEAREFWVKGILQTKVDEMAVRVIVVDKDIRQLIGRDDLNRSEIAIKLKPGTDPTDVQALLRTTGADRNNLIETWEESQGTFFKEIATTFNVLGNFIGSIGLFIASITIFIIVFINAISRRKFIGILKAIGVKEVVIELAYVFQSMFYAVSGSIIGMLITFYVMVPYFEANPIDFPFSDGILATSFSGAIIRSFLLFIITVLAGYVPARMIVTQNTVDAILGR